MYRDIPHEKRRAIADDYRVMSGKKVAQKHGIYFTTVYTIVREFGEPIRVGGKPVACDEWQFQPQPTSQTQESLTHE